MTQAIQQFANYTGCVYTLLGDYEGNLEGERCVCVASMASSGRGTFVIVFPNGYIDHFSEPELESALRFEGLSSDLALRRYDYFSDDRVRRDLTLGRFHAAFTEAFAG